LRRVTCFYKCWAVLAALGCTVAAGVDRAASDPVSPPAAAQIRVTLASAAGEPLAGEGFVVFQGAASAAPIVVSIKLPGAASAELPAGSHWTLIVDFPGYFAANSVLQVPREALTAPLEVPVTLRPAGTLTGKFTVEGKEKLPEGLVARFEPTREPPPRKQDIPASQATCAVGSSGEWRCRLPAGRLDVALHPRGFVPHYLRNLEVKPGGASSLGLRKLIRGASVAGWVTREDGTPAEKCRVRIEPAVGPGSQRDPTLEFLQAVASEVPCQKNGFFQSSALAAGSYVLVAQEKDARAQMSPVQVWEGAESRLTAPIVLRRPVDFEVALSPPVDWLGRPWRVEAQRALDHRTGWEEPPYRTEANQEGSVRLPKQTPGRFAITVYDQLGNALFSDLNVKLSDPAQPYPITLDLLWVEGTVHLGDEPVAGRVFFGGRNATVSIKMTSNESGRFEGPLPRAGSWRVDVEGDEPRLNAKTRVEVKPKGDRASVSIELPNTSVSGRVVDPEGMPARGAHVVLSSIAGPTLTKADEKGEFELRHFVKGTNELSSWQSLGAGEREASDAYLFEAVEDEPHGPVVLTLRRNRVIRGRIVAATGPVIGATVSAWPAIGGDGGIQKVRSRLDGDFELKVPVGTQALRVIVSPPGGALKIHEVNVASDAELLFQAEPLGGELVVTTKGEGLTNEVAILWQEDIRTSLGMLKEWAEGHGGHWQGGQVRIPQLAPGSYTVCLGAPEVSVTSEPEAWKSRAKCAAGYLAAGSSLNLRIPDP
jgi:hypothetical protein